LNSVKSELNEAMYAEPERPKLQYHPEFHNRDPLPESIPAEGNGDLNHVASASDSATGQASPVGNATASDDAPARALPSD
jgi:hypothetical protein